MSEGLAWRTERLRYERGGPTLIWQTYPMGVLGADQSDADRTCRGALRDLVEWLPHLAAIGADTLLLGPIFASLSHGYDTVTHRAIDERLGTATDLDALIAAGAAHGSSARSSTTTCPRSSTIRLTPARPSTPSCTGSANGSRVGRSTGSCRRCGCTGTTAPATR